MIKEKILKDENLRYNFYLKYLAKWIAWFFSVIEVYVIKSWKMFVVHH